MGLLVALLRTLTFQGVLIEADAALAAIYHRRALALVVHILFKVACALEIATGL